MPDSVGGPVSRRLAALRRGARFRVRTLIGKAVCIHVDIRWRLGDEIMALPIYESIKRARPRSTLSVSCSYPELLDGNPFVDRVRSSIDDSSLRDYDQLIDLRNASRVEPRQSHYARLAGVPVPKNRPRVYWGEDSPPIEMNDSAGPWIAVSTGASWATKRWPRANWIDLCGMLSDRGCQLVQLGRDDESIGVGCDLLDKTSVREAGAALKKCAVFVGCDSGLLHLASALGTPSVGLFGPTDPGILFDERDPITFLRNDRSCQGCWNGPLTMKEPGVCPEDIQCCLEPIEVDAVLENVLRTLDAAAPEERCA